MDNDLPSTIKSLGQHWLDDPASLDAMVEAAGIGPDDTVLEIGSGPGSLTGRLVKRAKRVVAVEFDEVLARSLPKRIKADNLEVVQQDILRFNLDSLPPDYKIAANIPYYLTSKLLRVLCESPNHFDTAALLIQKEVAERVCAGPGDMGLLSVSVQFYCQTGLGPVVPAELFVPPPKVDSQILMLTYRKTPLFPDVDKGIFFKLVKAGFSQRRKTILNSLGGGLAIDRAATATLLGAAGIDPGTRAQTLGLDDWYRLSRCYNGTN